MPCQGLSLGKGQAKPAPLETTPPPDPAWPLNSVPVRAGGGGQCLGEGGAGAGDAGRGGLGDGEGEGEGGGGGGNGTRQSSCPIEFR